MTTSDSNPVKWYHVQRVNAGHIVRMGNDFCSGYLADNHCPPSGRYDKCGIVNVPSGAIIFPTVQGMMDATAYLETQGYQLSPYCEEPWGDVEKTPWHVIVDDGDGNHWVCPADKEDEANKAIEAVQQYWADYEGPEPTIPDYMKAIDNPARIKFREYRID